MKSSLQWTFRAVASLVVVGNAWRWCLACLVVLGLSSCASPAMQGSDWRSLDGPKANVIKLRAS